MIYWFTHTQKKCSIDKIQSIEIEHLLKPANKMQPIVLSMGLQNYKNQFNVQL